MSPKDEKTPALNDIFYSHVRGCYSLKSGGWILTHGWSSQCLSSDQLGGAKTIQEVAELRIRGESHSRKDEAGDANVCVNISSRLQKMVC